MTRNEEDAFNWAVLVLQVKSDNKEIADRALVALKSPLERLAGLIAGNSSLRPWLVDNAWSLVWEKIISRESFDFASVRNARAWCATVLRSRFRDEIRRCTTRIVPEPQPASDSLRLGQIPQPEPGSLKLDEIAELDLAMPFSDGDLQAIGEWPTTLRVRMMCMSRLWVKIPPGVWKEWTVEEGLGPDFPPDSLRQSLLQCDNRHDRIMALEATGLAKKNTLQQMWGNEEPRLWKLKFIKDMFPTQAETVSQENH